MSDQNLLPSTTVVKKRSSNNKQKVKIQQIMSISIENLTKKTNDINEVQDQPIIKSDQTLPKFDQQEILDFHIDKDDNYQQENIKNLEINNDSDREEKIKRFSFSHPFQHVEIENQEQYQYPQPKIIDQIDSIENDQENQKQYQQLQQQQEQEQQQQTPQLFNESQDLSILQSQKLSIKSENQSRYRPFKENKKVSSINNMLDNFMNQRCKQPELTSVFDEQNVNNNESVYLDKQEDLNNFVEQPVQLSESNLNQNNNEYDLDSDLNFLVQELYENTTKYNTKTIFNELKPEDNQKSFVKSQQQSQNYDKSAAVYRLAQFNNHNNNNDNNNYKKVDIRSNQISDTQQKIKLQNDNSQQYVNEKSTHNQEINLQKYNSNTVNNGNSNEKIGHQDSSPQNQLKNSLLVSNTQQSEVTHKNVSNPQKHHQNDKEIQISQKTKSNNQHIEKQIRKQTDDITFRYQQRELMTVYQYLFKYSKLKSKTQDDKLQLYEFQDINKYYQANKLTYEEKYNFEQFVSHLQKVDLQFFELCEENQILYQFQDTKEIIWNQPGINMNTIIPYLQSLGFVLGTNEKQEIINNIQNSLNHRNQLINDQLDQQQIYYAIYLALNYVPKPEDLYEVLEFFSEQEESVIDIVTMSKVVKGNWMLYLIVRTMGKQQKWIKYIKY